MFFFLFLHHCSVFCVLNPRDLFKWFMMVLKPFSDIEGGHSFHLFVLVSSNLDAWNASNLLNSGLDVCGFYSWIATYCWWKTSTRTTIFWWHPTWWLMVVSHCWVSWVILDFTLFRWLEKNQLPGVDFWWMFRTPVFTVFSGHLYYSYNLCDRQRILTAAFFFWSGVGW